MSPHTASILLFRAIKLVQHIEIRIRVIYDLKKDYVSIYKKRIQRSLTLVKTGNVNLTKQKPFK